MPRPFPARQWLSPVTAKPTPTTLNVRLRWPSRTITAGAADPRRGAANRVLRKVAQEIRLKRADLMGAALAEGGKTLTESDPEVSEAVDFVEFYPQTAEFFAQLPGIQAAAAGCRRRRLTLEFSHRDSLRRRGGRAGRR